MNAEDDNDANLTMIFTFLEKWTCMLRDWTDGTGGINTKKSMSTVWGLAFFEILRLFLASCYSH